MGNNPIQGLFVVSHDHVVADLLDSNDVQRGQQTDLNQTKFVSRRAGRTFSDNEQLHFGQLIDRLQSKGDVFPFAGHLNARLGVSPGKEIVRGAIEHGVGRWGRGTIGVAHQIVEFVSVVANTHFELDGGLVFGEHRDVEKGSVQFVLLARLVGQRSNQIRLRNLSDTFLGTLAENRL